MSSPIIRPLQASIQRLAIAGPSRPPLRAYSPLPRRLTGQPTPISARSLQLLSRWHSTDSTDRGSDQAKGQDGAAPDEQSDQDALRIGAPAPGAKSQPIAKLEPRLSLTFTCTADACGHRSTHEFSKRSYTRGIVLVQCPSCKNRHLIADHLGWFKESTEDGSLKTVEDLLRAKGEKVRTGKVNFDGDIEYDPEETV